ESPVHRSFRQTSKSPDRRGRNLISRNVLSNKMRLRTLCSGPHYFVFIADISVLVRFEHFRTNGADLLQCLLRTYVIAADGKNDAADEFERMIEHQPF